MKASFVGETEQYLCVGTNYGDVKKLKVITSMRNVDDDDSNSARDLHI